LKAPHPNNILVFERQNRVQGGLEDATMTQVKDIKKMYFEERKNISEIARKTGHDRKTVMGYINKDDWNEKLPKVKKEDAFPKLDPYKQDIDTWLTEDKKAR
jgi:hypothetical protein